MQTNVNFDKKIRLQSVIAAFASYDKILSLVLLFQSDSSDFFNKVAKMSESESKSSRLSIRQWKDSSLFKGIQKRFENLSIENLKSKTPQRNVFIRRHTLKESTIPLGYRNGLVISSPQATDSRVGNTSDETCQDSNENIKNPSFVHKQFRQVGSSLSYQFFYCTSCRVEFSYKINR